MGLSLSEKSMKLTGADKTVVAERTDTARRAREDSASGNSVP